MTLAPKVSKLHHKSEFLATIGARPVRGALHQKSKESAEGAQCEDQGQARAKQSASPLGCDKAREVKAWRAEISPVLRPFRRRRLISARLKRRRRSLISAQGSSAARTLGSEH